MEATFAEIWGQVKKECRNRIKSDESRVSNDLKPILRQIGDRIFDPGFNVNSLLSEGSVKSTTWERFRQEVGKSPWDYITQRRLETADALITVTDAKVWLIAELVGHADPGNFGTWYRKHTGSSPTQARREAARKVRASSANPLRPADETWTNFCRKLVEEIDELEAELGHGEVLKLFRTRLVLRTGQLFEALSERSRSIGRSDRQRGIELAELALASAEGQRFAPRDLAAELRCRGLARLANARRLATDYAGSERALSRAARMLETVPVERRPAAEGEYLCYRGSLRRFQRRFTEAREDLHRAAALCRSTGQSRLEAGAWMQLAAVLYHEGECEAALIPLLSAQRLTEETLGHDSHLRVVLLAQLACVQAEGGHATEALHLLPEVRRLADELEHATLAVQADWIEALARRSQGCTEAAELLLKQAREGFLRHGDIDHMAIVSLDLALLYEEQGLSINVAHLAAEALPALAALRVPEAAESLRLLQRAINADQIARQVLLATRRFLLSAW